MKVNILEAHDRKKHLIKDQSENIFRGAEDCLRKNSDSLFYQDRSPYVYIFAHPRTADDGVNKRMLWQPRLMKPEAQTNSYLFRAKSHSDLIEVCWLLPPQELWRQYKEGNMLENQDIICSIDNYIYNKKQLEARHSEDLPEERCKQILQELIRNKKFEKLVKQSGKITPLLMQSS
jgi:hypothetical protein